MRRLSIGSIQGKGFSLLEVLVAIVIFAIGMLALFQLQGGLSKSASDANMRTVAVNIAEAIIEEKRGFKRVDVDPDGIDPAYEDIADFEDSQTRGAFDFEIEGAVVDYWYDDDTESFTYTEPVTAANSDFKLVTITVTWNDSQEFRIDDGNTTTGGLGSGQITLTEMISSITSAADAKSSTGGTGGLYFPTIDYNPGSNPEIISISLGENRFKESTTPLPNVVRTDELVETTFDVVTYSQDDEGATFLRREEFRSVSCECTLRAPVGNDDGGYRPAVWVGVEYSETEWVSKPYGESNSNQQSAFCDICCRDHHDGGTGEDDDSNDPGRAKIDAFRPAADYWTSGSLVGDHKHYNRNSEGGLTVAASVGDDYVEACRLVRKDGFFRVAHDLRQEGLNSFPENYLDNTAEVAVYSTYVTDAVTDFNTAIGTTNLYEQNPPTLTAPLNMSPTVWFPASVWWNATWLPTLTGSTSQQLRSRGIYVDYFSDELRAIIDCLNDGGTGIDCDAPNVTTALEIIPFYDVQLTWLSRWNETPVNNPVDVTNEAVETNNAHSRGVANLGQGFGISTVNAAVHKGNLGLTATDPIDLAYSGDLRSYNMYVLAIDGTPEPDDGIAVVAGTITSAVGGVHGSDVEISFHESQCDRTNTGYACSIDAVAHNPRITVSNYAKNNVILVACSTELETNGQQVTNGNWTRFDLPLTTNYSSNIVIKTDTC